MFRSFFSKLLPPPAYLTLPAVGVDISDTSLKYIAFAPTTRTDEPRKLVQWGDIDIPDGVVSRGKIIDPEKLTKVLLQCKRESGAEFIRVSLPEERAYLFETEIKKKVPYKEMKGLLEFRLEENVPIPSREVLFDFSILPHSTSAATPIAVVAYARETIDAYYAACLAAGLRPVSFEVEAQAVARAAVPANNTGATMLIDFGKTRTGIGIVHHGQLLYTSTIDIGGATLSTAMRSVLGADTPESELTTLKNEVGLVHSNDTTQVAETLLPVIEKIKDEIVTRMQYWHLRGLANGERRITSAVLCGGSANLNGLPTYLTEKLGVPAVLANVWENAFPLENTVPPIDMRHSFGYATAIGLALADIAS